MFKNSQYVCHIFFVIDDVIVTSVITYTSMMGISSLTLTWNNFRCRQFMMKVYRGLVLFCSVFTFTFLSLSLFKLLNYYRLLR